MPAWDHRRPLLVIGFDDVEPSRPACALRPSPLAAGTAPSSVRSRTLANPAVCRRGIPVDRDDQPEPPVASSSMSLLLHCLAEHSVGNLPAPTCFGNVMFVGCSGLPVAHDVGHSLERGLGRQPLALGLLEEGVTRLCLIACGCDSSSGMSACSIKLDTVPRRSSW